MLARRNGREEQLMVALTQDLGELTDEFALVGEAAADAGRPDAPARGGGGWARGPGRGGAAPGRARGRHRPARARAVRLAPGRAVRAGPDHAGGGRGPTGLGAAGASGGGGRAGGGPPPGPPPGGTRGWPRRSRWSTRCRAYGRTRAPVRVRTRPATSWPSCRSR